MSSAALTESAAREQTPAREPSRPWYLARILSRNLQHEIEHLTAAGFEIFRPFTLKMVRCRGNQLSQAQRRNAVGLLRPRPCPLLDPFLLCRGAAWWTCDRIGFVSNERNGFPAEIAAAVVDRLRAYAGAGDVVPGNVPAGRLLGLTGELDDELQAAMAMKIADVDAEILVKILVRRATGRAV